MSRLLLLLALLVFVHHHHQVELRCDQGRAAQHHQQPPGLQLAGVGSAAAPVVAGQAGEGDAAPAPAVASVRDGGVLAGYPDRLPSLDRDGVVGVSLGAWDAFWGGKWGDGLAILVAAAVIILRQLATRVPVLGHRMVIAAQVFLLSAALHLVGWSSSNPLTFELVGGALRTGVEAAGGFSLLKATFETMAQDFGWSWARVVLDVLSPPRPTSTA